MGFFGAKGVSKKPVSEWTPERVSRWLSAMGKAKYETQFRGITGERLLKLTNEDVYQLTDSRLDGDIVIDGLKDLRKRDGLSDSQRSESSKISRQGVDDTENIAPQNSTQDLPQMPIFVKTSKGHGPGKITSSISSGTHSPLARTETPTNAETPRSRTITPHNSHTGVEANAAVLAEFVGNEDVVAGLFEYMTLLGIQGMGLVEATERAPIVGHLIGAIWELHDLVADAKGNRPNCEQLNTYCQDILRVFDAEGKRLAFIDESALKRALILIEQGIAVVESNCRPGWLLRMATNDKSVEEFQAIHNGILDVLRTEKVDTLPNGRQLTYGEYRDASRPLKRLLKQLGSGSLDAGLNFVSQHEDAQTSISQLIGIDKQYITKDLDSRAAHPEIDLLSTNDASSFSGDALTANMTQTRDREFHTIFAQYDKNGSGALEFEELRSVLADLSLLENIKPSEIEPYTRQQFEIADADGDGRVGYEEFVHYYQAITTSKARRELRAIMGPHAEKELKKIFSSFVSFGVRQHVGEMDGARFSKLCRDCKLLGKNFTTIDVDLIFAKIKVKGHRRISFDGFLASLLEIAEKKKQPLDNLVEQILSAGGPTVTATKADYVKFHDDKSTYTGVYSRGGPTNVDPSKDLSALLDRSEADVRGVKKRMSNGGSASKLSSQGRNSSTGGSFASLDGGSQRSGPASRRDSLLGEGVTSDPNRRESSTGSYESARSRKASLNGDLTHQISHPAHSRRSSNGGLPPIPPSFGSGGTPRSSTNHPVQSHTSETLETRENDAHGANTKSSPESLRSEGSNGAASRIPRLPNPANASQQDTMKILSETMHFLSDTMQSMRVNAEKDGGAPIPQESRDPSNIVSDSQSGKDETKNASQAIRDDSNSNSTPQRSKDDLKNVFIAFASFGSRASHDGAIEMDGAKFAKLCRECHLLGGGFTSTSADLVFSKVRVKGRKIDFKGFKRAVEEIAKAKKTDKSVIEQQIVSSGGPQVAGTTPSCHVRLHDDKSSYTGVYKAGGPSVIDKHITLENLTDRTNTQTPPNRPRMTI